MYKAVIMKMTDLYQSQQNHISISGGRATHNFEKIGELKQKRLSDLKKQVELELGLKIGNNYDAENQAYLVEIPSKLWDEVECPEYYEIQFSKITEKIVK